MDSSSFGSYTWKKPWEEAMGVGVNVGLWLPGKRLLEYKYIK